MWVTCTSAAAPISPQDCRSTACCAPRRARPFCRRSRPDLDAGRRRSSGATASAAGCDTLGMPECRLHDLRSGRGLVRRDPGTGCGVRGRRADLQHHRTGGVAAYRAPAANSGAAPMRVGAIATQIQTAATNTQTVSLSQSRTLGDVITNARRARRHRRIGDTRCGAAMYLGLEHHHSECRRRSGHDRRRLLQAVVGAATVAQGDAADALAQAGANENTAAAKTDFTGTNLDRGRYCERRRSTSTRLRADGDDVVGTAGADTLDGQGGNDNVFGGGGKDFLIGGPGDDVLYGDTLVVSQASPDDGVRPRGLLRRDRQDQRAAGLRRGQSTTGATQLSQDLLVSVECDHRYGLRRQFRRDRLLGHAAPTTAARATPSPPASAPSATPTSSRARAATTRSPATVRPAPAITSATAGVTVNLATGAAARRRLGWNDTIRRAA